MTSIPLRSRFPFHHLVGALLALHAAAASIGTAQTLTASTMPMKAENGIQWRFSGDKAIAVRTDSKDGQVLALIDAVSLADGKSLWHVEQAAGTDKMGLEFEYVPDPTANRWYIGTGPVSCLDLDTGQIKWTIPAKEIGFIEPGLSRILPEHRLLASGSTKVDPGKLWDARKEPQYAMIDTESGKVLWKYATKSLEYETGLGYWARVAKYQGKHVEGDKYLQISAFFVTPDNVITENSRDNPDRLAIAGERWEAVKLSDGSPIFKTKDKPGILKGTGRSHAYFRDGDKLTAYEAATGKPVWTFDLQKKGGRVYTADDLIDEKHGVPDGMTDIMISESEVVSRVSAETGKALFTVKRDGKVWQGSKHALLVKGNDKTIAYDWNTGAKLWEAKVGSKPKGYDVGDYIVFVDSKDRTETGQPIPPFELTTVSAKTGQVLWSKKDLGGKKITDLAIPLPGIVMIQSNDDVAFLDVTNGATITKASDAKPDSTGATDGAETSYSVAFSEKGVSCRDRAGKLLWERKGEKYFPPKGQPKRGLVIWATADGTVEVIGAADGSTKWKAQVDKNPDVSVSDDWSYLVVPNKGKKDVSIVKLTP